MKYKSILSLFIFLLGFGVSTTSCEDMLTPDMDRYSENFSGNDTVYFYLGILRNVQDMVEQNELLGDMRSDLVTTTSYSSDSIADIMRKNNTYSDYEVERRKDKHYGMLHLLVKPLFRSFKGYVLKGGFKDGLPGLIYTFLLGVYQFMVVAKVMEKKNKRRCV